MDASRDASLGVPYALVESYTAMAVSSSPLRSVYALVESYAAWLLPWDVDVERVKDVLAFYALFCATWSIAKAIYRTVRIFLCVFGEIANMFAAYHMASHVFARLRVKQEQQEKEQKQKQEQEKDQVSRRIRSHEDPKMEATSILRRSSRTFLIVANASLKCRHRSACHEQCMGVTTSQLRVFITLSLTAISSN